MTGDAGLADSQPTELHRWEVVALDDLSTDSIQNVARRRERPQCHAEAQ